MYLFTKYIEQTSGVRTLWDRTGAKVSVSRHREPSKTCLFVSVERGK